MAGEHCGDLRVAEERLLLGADHPSYEGERRRPLGGHPVPDRREDRDPDPIASTAASTRLRARLTGTSTRGGVW
jgi:hypothetical protein